jgi:F-type H+-transporting ATPase subunit b
MPAKIAAIHVVQASNPLLAPSPGLMIWTLVTFGITLYVLRKYVFPPIAKAIETRRVEISQSIDEAERSRDEALQLLDEYKARLSDAHKEADALRERGRKDGERRGAELVASAEMLRRDRPHPDCAMVSSTLPSRWPRKPRAARSPKRITVG